jgi:hypothetical protein
MRHAFGCLPGPWAAAAVLALPAAGALGVFLAAPRAAVAQTYPAAAQQHAVLSIAHGAIARARLEALSAAPDTVTMRDLTRGVPIVLRLVEAPGQPIPVSVQWRVLAGDAAFTSVAGHSDADGFARAVLGRVPWLGASAGTVTLEATTRSRGTMERIRMSFVLVRN